MRTEDRVDRMLDSALEMTFPASDPIAIYIPDADSTAGNDREQTSDSLPLAA